MGQLGISGHLLLLALDHPLGGCVLVCISACATGARGEDFRYRAFREAWGKTIIWRSFLQIYLLQGAVVFVVAMPILLAIAESRRWPALD